jgi:hypothetical protein
MRMFVPPSCSGRTRALSRSRLVQQRTQTRLGLGLGVVGKRAQVCNQAVGTCDVDLRHSEVILRSGSQLAAQVLSPERHVGVRQTRLLGNDVREQVLGLTTHLCRRLALCHGEVEQHDLPPVR